MGKDSQLERDALLRVRWGYKRPASVPAQLLELPNISSHAKCAYALLDIYSHQRDENEAPPQERLARDMGISGPTVRRALKELVDIGYLRKDAVVDSLGRRAGTTYTLTDAPRDWGSGEYRQEFGSSVYFIQRGETGPIKIGVSTNVAGRLRTLEARFSEPLVLLGTLPGGADLEQALHARFRDQRIEGEWFRPSPELFRLACGVSRTASSTFRGGES